MTDYPHITAEYVKEIERLEAEIVHRKQAIYRLMQKAKAAGIHTPALRAVATNNHRGREFWVAVAKTLSEMEAK